MQVGIEQVLYPKMISVDVLFQLLLLFGIIASRINHNGFSRFVGKDITVNGKHIEFKTFDYHGVIT